MSGFVDEGLRLLYVERQRPLLLSPDNTPWMIKSRTPCPGFKALIFLVIPTKKRLADRNLIQQGFFSRLF
jgi:hypothetical protein